LHHPSCKQSPYPRSTRADFVDILAFRNRVIPERLFIYLFIYFTWLFEHQKLLIGQVFVVDFVFLLSIQLILLSNGERVSVELVSSPGYKFTS